MKKEKSAHGKSTWPLLTVDEKRGGGSAPGHMERGCSLEACGWRLEAWGCRLDAQGCKLQAWGCRLQAWGCRLQARYFSGGGSAPSKPPGYCLTV